MAKEDGVEEALRVRHDGTRFLCSPGTKDDSAHDTGISTARAADIGGEGLYRAQAQDGVEKDGSPYALDLSSWCEESKV